MPLKKSRKALFLYFLCMTIIESGFVFCKFNTTVATGVGGELTKPFRYDIINAKGG